MAPAHPTGHRDVTLPTACSPLRRRASTRSRTGSTGPARSRISDSRRAAVLVAAIGPLSIAALCGLLPYDTVDDTVAIVDKVAAHPGAENAVLWLSRDPAYPFHPVPRSGRRSVRAEAPRPLVADRSQAGSGTPPVSPPGSSGVASIGGGGSGSGASGSSSAGSSGTGSSGLMIGSGSGGGVLMPRVKHRRTATQSPTRRSRAGRLTTCCRCASGVGQGGCVRADGGAAQPPRRCPSGSPAATRHRVAGTALRAAARAGSTRSRAAGLRAQANFADLTGCGPGPSSHRTPRDPSVRMWRSG